MEGVYSAAQRLSNRFRGSLTKEVAKSPSHLNAACSALDGNARPHKDADGLEAGLAFGYRLGGWSGTVAALLGLTLPGFASTVVLIAGYTALKNTRLFALLPVVFLVLVVPSAVGLVLTLS